MANSKAPVKIFDDSVHKYEGIATLCVMIVHSRDLGRLRAYF